MPVLNNGGIMEKEKILEGWKEIAEYLGGYHPDHARRLFRVVRNRIQLRYWLGPHSVIRMTPLEAETFKKLLGDRKQNGSFSNPK